MTQPLLPMTTGSQKCLLAALACDTSEAPYWMSGCDIMILGCTVQRCRGSAVCAVPAPCASFPTQQDCRPLFKGSQHILPCPSKTTNETAATMRDGEHHSAARIIGLDLARGSEQSVCSGESMRFANRYCTVYPTLFFSENTGTRYPVLAGLEVSQRSSLLNHFAAASASASILRLFTIFSSRAFISSAVTFLRISMKSL